MSPDQPPARDSETGSIRPNRPTVMMRNCAMSARVIDHLPPITAYASTIPPPTTMDNHRSQPKSTTKTEA